MRRQPDGTYVVADLPILLYAGALLFAGSFALAAARFAHAGALDWKAPACALAAVGSLVLGGAIAYTRFSFDPARKLIAWTTRSLFRGDGGQLEFSDVSSVVLQTTQTDRGGTCYRVALVARDRTLPMSAEYDGNRVKMEKLAEQVRELLGLTTQHAAPKA